MSSQSYSTVRAHRGSDSLTSPSHELARCSYLDMCNRDSQLWQLRYQTNATRSLYLHIPFCEKRCSYCDFATWKTKRADPLMRRYVIALQHQLEHLGSLGLLDEANYAYIGGGTPSMLGEWLSWLCETVTRWVEVREFSCECNPESFDGELAERLRAQSVTRLSFGVQSLDDQELAALGRIHTAERALEALTCAREYGFVISADLMCGIPHQTETSFTRSLQQLIDTGIDHVSIYPLSVEERTLLGHLVRSGKMPAPNEDLQADLMEAAQSILLQAGYERYEVASYAYKGSVCRHNLSYWQGISYLGLGTSAASMMSAGAYMRLKGAAPQLPELPSDCFRVRLRVLSSRFDIARDRGLSSLDFDVECLTVQEALAEDLMLAARTTQGISPALLESASFYLGEKSVHTAIDKLIEEGLVRFTTNEFLAPTQLGWLLGNRLYGTFWELALPAQ